jgi:replicative DNA helicase
MNEYYNVVDEVELNLLSLLLDDGSYIYEADRLLKPMMFSSKVHETIFAGMSRLAGKGIEPSVLLLKNELQLHDEYDVIGGDVYLNELKVAKPQTGAFKEYISIIENAYKSRVLLRLSNAISTDIENNIDVDKVISALIKNLDSLNTLGGNQEVIQVNEVVDDFMTSLESRIGHPGITGLSTGFNSIDLLTMGYNEGDVWVIGARPSMGKTAFVVKTGLHLAKNGVPFLLINREMGIVPVLERIYAILTGIDLMKIRMGNLTQDEFDLISSIRADIENYPFFIDNSWGSDERSLYSTIRKYSHKENIRVVGVDYIQLLAERDKYSTHNIGRICRNIKLLSGELDLTSLVVSQLSRDVEYREDKRPIMKDLRQSGNLEEDADIIGILYRDEVYTVNSPLSGTMEFIIRKSRNGPIGTCNLGFVPETVDIYDKNDMKMEFDWDAESK